MASDISTHAPTGDPVVADTVARTMAMIADMSELQGEALNGALLAAIHTVAVELAHTQRRCAELEERITNGSVA